MIGTFRDGMFSDGTFSDGTFSDRMFSDGMFSDGTFSDGTFSDGMFSDGTFSDGTFCMRTIGRGGSAEKKPQILHVNNHNSYNFSSITEFAFENFSWAGKDLS